ncbi:MAG: hypothetical protein RLZZ28_986 [Bacteroidota bacterium]
MQRGIFNNPIALLVFAITSTTSLRATTPFFPAEDSTKRMIAEKIFTEFKQSHANLNNTDTARWIAAKEVADRLLAVLDKLPKEKNTYLSKDDWDGELVLVNESARADAWILPGGKIAVYNRVLSLTQSRASLAVVLSHEIAHLLLSHGDQRMQVILKDYFKGRELAAAFAEKPVETGDFFKLAYGFKEGFGIIGGFSLSEELDADQLGSLLMALAGFRPTEAIVFWERMAKLKGTGSEPELLTMHQLSDKRMNNLKQKMEQIEKQYYRPINKN